MHDMLFLIRVGPLDIPTTVPAEVLRSSMNLDLLILEYNLPAGFIRYQIDFRMPDQVRSAQFTLQVDNILNPTEQRVRHPLRLALIARSRPPSKSGSKSWRF